MSASVPSPLNAKLKAKQSHPKQVRGRGRPRKSSSAGVAVDVNDNLSSKKKTNKKKKRERQSSSQEDDDDMMQDVAATTDASSSPASSSNGHDGEVDMDQLHLVTPTKKAKSHHKLDKKLPSSARKLEFEEPTGNKPLQRLIKIGAPQSQAMLPPSVNATDEANEHKYDSGSSDDDVEDGDDDDALVNPLPIDDSSDDEEEKKGDHPDGGEDDAAAEESDDPEDDATPTSTPAISKSSIVIDGDEEEEDDDDVNIVPEEDECHPRVEVEEEEEVNEQLEGEEDEEDDDDEEVAPVESESDASEAPKSRRSSRQPPKTPTKNSTVAKAVIKATAEKLKQEAKAEKVAAMNKKNKHTASSKSSVKKTASSAAAAASSTSSPVKKWIAPIATSTFTSQAAGAVSSSAKQYNIRVLVVGDMGTAINASSKVARKYMIVAEVETSNIMILIGYAEDATKYMANMEYGEFYTLDLESKVQTVGKSLCLPNHTHYFKIAAGTKIRRYIINETCKREYDESKNAERLCEGIATLSRSNPDDLANVYGIVMKVATQQMRNGVGLKVVLADGTGYVNVMFFEAKANIVVGSSMVLIGAKVWKNTRTKAIELSVYNSTVVMVNLLPLGKSIMKRCKKQDYSTLSNVSTVPSAEPRTMHDLKEEATSLANDTDSVGGTVILNLDPARPANNGSINYNGCVKCKRKVKPIDEQDEDGNTYFDHDVDRGDSHKALTYNSHFLFNGRFKETDNNDYFLAQVDDKLGEGMFGLTANAFSELNEEARTALMSKTTSTSFKFNVTVAKGGEITSMILV